MLMADRNSDGIEVELHWNQHDLENEYEVRVNDTRTDSNFTLHPETGKQALHAFYHPFVAANHCLTAGKIAA